MEIWEFPDRGKPPDLADLLQAMSVAELARLSAGQAEDGDATDPGLSLWARLRRIWGARVRPGAGAGGGAEDTPQLDPAEPFAFRLPLARTGPDAPPDDVAQMVEAVIRQISAQRGRGPQMIKGPEALAEGTGEARHIVAYWPPFGQPALMLMQRPKGTSTEIDLLAHGSAAHRRLVAELEAAGGTLEGEP